MTKTIHHWFQSGTYRLLAHTSIPERSGRLGVIMMPPFGWEDVSSYRPLRFLAIQLAENGIPALRYDLPGTGDSSGGAWDDGLVAAWIQSAGDAARELRAITGIDRVAVVGTRLGALLAIFAAARARDIGDLVLWGPARSGRAELRELRAFAKMERWEYATTPGPSLPDPLHFEVGGFLMSPETLHDLEALEPAALSSLGGRRVLILSRDHLRPDSELVRALASAGCAVAEENGAGYSAMMTEAHEAHPPEATARVIIDFLTGGRQDDRISLTTHGPRSAGPEPVLDAIVERADTVESPWGSIFGVIAEPARGTPRAECCALFLNAGGVRHIGPNRMWVEAARRLAAEGGISLRFDLPGIGESGGDPGLNLPALYQKGLVEQVEFVMESLKSRFGFTRFAVAGLCSGAFWAFHAALRNVSISSATLLNPRLFFWGPGVDRRRLIRRGLRALIRWEDWYRVAHGGVRLRDLQRAARTVLAGSRAHGADPAIHGSLPPEMMAGAWKTIEHRGTRIALVFTEGEPLLREMESEAQLPPLIHSRMRLTRIANAGHTFRPQWAQRIVLDLIDHELNAALRQSDPDSMAQAI